MCSSVSPWLGGRACRGLCEGREAQRISGAGTRKGRNNVEKPGKDVRFASVIALCQKRRGKAVTGGGRETGEAGNEVYLDVYGQMAYSEI